MSESGAPRTGRNITVVAVSGTAYMAAVVVRNDCPRADLEGNVWQPRGSLYQC